MVSRRSTGPLRKILPAVAVGLAAIGLVGCSAGQVTQTDRVLPAVDGNAGDAGDNALRDVLIAAPESGGNYSAGDDAPLTLTIVNRGTADDELTSVSSPAAGKVELIGDTTLPSRAALRVLVPEESSSSSASATSTETSATSESSPGSTETSQSGGSSSAAGTAASEPAVTGTELAPEVVGSLSIVLTDLTADLLPGRNVPITFVFAEGGSVTINVPIDNAGDARTASADSESE
jgi:copper(I)-binding protein